MRTHQLVRVIQFASGQQIKAGRIDNDGHLPRFDHMIVCRPLRIQFEFILEPVAATSGNNHPQGQIRLPTCGYNFSDPAGRTIGNTKSGCITHMTEIACLPALLK